MTGPDGSCSNPQPLRPGAESGHEPPDGGGLMTSANGREVLALQLAVGSDEVVRALADLGVAGADIARAMGSSARSSSVHEAARADEARLRELAEIVLLLAETLTTRGVGQWLHARNRLLGNACPLDLIAEGDAARAREAAASFVDGAVV